MKVVVLSESSADEAAIEGYVGALRSAPIARILPQVESRGWPSVSNVLSAVIRQLHYQTDADALAVVVDSNGSDVHDPTRTVPCASDCRLCKLQTQISTTISSLSPVAGRAPLKHAVGLAVPAIEAWYLYGRKPTSEAVWLAGVGAAAPYDKRQLKMWAYGTDRPSLVHETTVARAEVRRQISGGMLPGLETYFPGGFHTFADEIRAW